MEKIKFSKDVQIFRLIAEIDFKIDRNLSMGYELKILNVKMQRKIILTWIFYAFGFLYFPTSRIVQGDYSVIFFDSLFRLVSWSFLVHVNITKYLYFFSLLSIRLEIIKRCLTKIEIDSKFNNFYVKRAKFNLVYAKLMSLKEIYSKCWKIQENTLVISGPFLLIYFIGYVGQIMYILFFFMKKAILEEKFSLIDNVLWFLLLNVFTIAFFIVSHKIVCKGLKISGLIHQIAHTAISNNDTQLVEAVKLFSLQIMQQPIVHVNIFGIFYYDRSNINGVS